MQIKLRNYCSHLLTSTAQLLRACAVLLTPQPGETTMDRQPHYENTISVSTRATGIFPFSTGRAVI